MINDYPNERINDIRFDVRGKSFRHLNRVYKNQVDVSSLRDIENHLLSSKELNFQKSLLSVCLFLKRNAFCQFHICKSSDLGRTLLTRSDHFIL